MNKQDIDQLNEEFAHKSPHSHLCFKDPDGEYPLIEIQTPQANAIIALQGAHLLSFKPKDEEGNVQEDIIWLSEDAKFKPGKSVRGGIPICWPWFGPHESDSDLPAHGFARTTPWQLLCVEELDNQNIRITFTTKPLSETEHMWPADTQVEYKITIGPKLEMELLTHNNGSEAITIGQALHTYFKVSDVSTVMLHGLSDTRYLDKVDNFQEKRQNGPVTINQEVDRIYLDTAGECVIEDKGLKRNIAIIKIGSKSTVVWNPWEATANKMGDLGEEGYKQMLCVESANAADDVVTIEPGTSHHLWVQYNVHEI